MKRDPWLSESIQDFISQRGQDDADYYHQISAEDRKYIMNIIELIIFSRENISGKSFYKFEQFIKELPDPTIHMINDYLCNKFIHDIPCYVMRILDLSSIESSIKAPNIVNSFLKEAVRTYILGLPQASIVLCRSTLEQALKDKIPELNDDTTLYTLIETAYNKNIIDQTIKSCSTEIRLTGRNAVHRNITELSQARDILIKLRGILQHLYS